MIIWTIAKATVGEALRKKILNVFLIVAVGMILISLYASGFSSPTPLEFRQELTIVKSFGLGMIALAALFISLVMGIFLIPSEIENRTLYAILSKPVKRYEYVSGKYLGGLLTLLINVGLMGLAFVVALLARGHGKFDPGILTGVVMIYFQFFLLASVTIFFSTFVTPTVNFFISLAVYVVGSLSSVTEAMAHSEKVHAVVRYFYTALHYVIPNFGNFNIQNPLIHPDVPIKNMTLYSIETILYAVVFAIVLLILGVLVFERKEV